VLALFIVHVVMKNGVSHFSVVYDGKLNMEFWISFLGFYNYVSTTTS